MILEEVWHLRKQRWNSSLCSAAIASGKIIQQRKINGIHRKNWN
jgi:hypothetical protein